MAQFTELGLQQCVIAGVVHQRDVIFKFGSKTDRKNVLGERNRVRFEQVTPDEGTGAAGGFNEPGPQRFQIAWGRRLCRRRGFLECGHWLRFDAR